MKKNLLRWIKTVKTDRGMIATLKQQSDQNISLLLPYYWAKGLPLFFEYMGFKMFWSENPDFSQKKIETERFVQEHEPDLALEWQRGEEDFPIRDLLRKYERKTPVVLALNWNGTLPGAPGQIGCAGCLNVPFKFTKMFSLFYKVLPEKKKRDFLHLHETNKHWCLFRIK